MDIQFLKAIPTSWEDPILTREQATELLHQPHHILLAMGDKHAPTAYVFARCMPESPADVLTLFVQPAARRKGHAQSLMNALLEVASAHACTGLTLEVEATNQAAIALYRVCGLQQVGKRVGYYHDPVSNLKADALVMAVTLA